jgi:hypothetical protein
MYDKGRNAFARGEIAWKSGGDTFRVYLVDGGDYTPDTAVDDFLDDIAGAGLVAYVALTPSDPAAGVCDAADATLPTVTGDQCEYLVIVKWSGNAATSPLLILIDTATGLPITPSGSDILITWDNGANKIFKL